MKRAGRNWGTVLSSVAFRFNLLYVLGLSLVVFLVMVLLYGAFTYGYFEEVQDSIVEELETLELIHAGQGLAGIEQYLADRRAADEAPRFHYLVTDSELRKLAGTLDHWPEYREFGDGWVSFGLEAADIGVFFSDAAELELLARTAELPDGGHVLVALRHGEIIASNRLVMKTLVRTMLVTVILGVIGGYFTAAWVLGRVDRVNQGIDRIVQGDLSQRIPMGDAGGQVRDLIENFNNMLDQTESLMQGVRTVSDNIAHDLRTPLTRVRNKLTELQAQVPENQRDLVQDIIEECDELLSTFNALLRIAQLEAGNRISNFVELDLGALVKDVVELYEPVAQDKNISLHSHCEPLAYQGDRDLIFQMVVNLLDNAVKYSAEGGSISVTVRVGADDRVMVSVADNGPGVPVADRENVFQRFFRLESSRGLQPGSGLGLSLVQAVVKLHRGVIRLLDNGPGLRVEVAL